MGSAKERRRRGKRNDGIVKGGGGASDNGKNRAHHSRQHIEAENAIRRVSDEPTPTHTGDMVYKPHATLLVQLTEETPNWYDCGRNTAGRDDTVYDADAGGKKDRQNANTREMVAKYRRLADEIYAREVALSRGRGGAGGASFSEKDEKWVENTMRRGTLKDRVAAMSVSVGADPVHRLHALDMLLDLVGCGVNGGGSDAGSFVPNSRVGQMASEALADLFVNTLLPSDRKLISLDDRPLYVYEGGRTLSPRVLLLWRYEEMVKRRYASYLSRYLGRTLSGEDEQSKKGALMTASALLRQVPEGEELLLTMIANKIGDPVRKIASAAGHQLRLVLEEHPVMVVVVAREVQQLAHRPHLSPRALYNCVVFLNQLQLSRDDDDSGKPGENDKKAPTKATSLPASLINTYFHLFEMTVKKDEASKKIKGSESKKQQSGSSKDALTASSKSRLLSALLTGVNRAHPYLPKKDAAMERHVDALYRISHTAPPAAATQALMLLFQLAVGPSDPANREKEIDDSTTARRDRFYRALYSKLADDNMLVSGRQLTLFFNLLYKAMKHDPVSVRAAAFAKRLMQTVLHHSSAIICGSLFLLSEIVRCRPELRREVESVAVQAAAVSFDPMKREPHAAFSGEVNNLNNNLWELSLLVHHFHPSVSKFAADSGTGEVLYKGDPLKDFALTPFLDKFAFRNPRSLDKLSRRLRRGESIAERKSGLSGSVALPMNDPSYLGIGTNIPEEEQFFHKFFAERARRDEIKGIVRGSSVNRDKDESDLEDEALNAAEADEKDVNFEGDTDSEEEAFLNQLAEKLMQSSGKGEADFEDEDPDMDDWSDMDEGGDKDDDKKEDEINMQDDDDSADFRDSANEDFFMDAASSDEEDIGGNIFGTMGGDDGDSESEADLPSELLGEVGSDDDSVAREDTKQKGKRKMAVTSAFADAEEYEQFLELELKSRLQKHQSKSNSAAKEEKISHTTKKRRTKKH